MAEFKNFKTGGPGSEAVEFVGSWDCFDAPSNTVFVVRVENKIQIRDIVCGLQLKKCMLYSKNSLNQTPKHLKHGGTPGAPVTDPHLKTAIMSSILTNKLCL